jgi:hypothetical protein
MVGWSMACHGNGRLCVVQGARKAREVAPTRFGVLEVNRHDEAGEKRGPLPDA